MERVTMLTNFECGMPPDRLFCDLPAEDMEALDVIKSVTHYPQGAVLFREGQPARGIFILCEGRAKLSVCSESGKDMIVRIAGPGEVLGLSASLSSGPYEMTAVALDQALAAVVKRKDLLSFLRDHHEACLQVVRTLSQDLHIAYDRVRCIGLGRMRRPRAMRAQ
jgi:CRP/FNR family transcriptional regulator